MTASIRLNGNPTPLQVLAAVPVSLSNFDNTGVLAWEWTLLDRPKGSTASITGAASPIASLTPDIPGTYLVRLRTWKDAGATILDDVDRAVTFVRYVPIPTWRIPAAGETTEVDPLRGWADEVNDILAYIQANIGVAASATYIASAPGGFAVPVGVAVGDVVYATGIDTADKADNAGIATARSIPGVVIAKPTPTSATVCYAGEAAVYAGLTAGATYYLGTAGALTTTAPVLSPTVARRIGVAKNATTLVVGLGEPIIN